MSIAFCFNFSSFSCNSFSFLSISFFLSSISMAVRQLLTSISSSRGCCKSDYPSYYNLSTIVNLFFRGLYDNEIWRAHPLKRKASYINKMLQAFTHQELRKQSREQVREGRKGKNSRRGMRRVTEITCFHTFWRHYSTIWLSPTCFLLLKDAFYFSKNLIPEFFVVCLLKKLACPCWRCIAGKGEYSLVWFSIIFTCVMMCRKVWIVWGITVGYVISLITPSFLKG